MTQSKEVGATCTHEFGLAIVSLEKHLGERGFAVGKCMSVADVLLGHTGMWAQTVKFETKSGPVQDYFSHMLVRPALARALAREEEYPERGGL